MFFHRDGKWEVYAQHECLLLIGPIHSGDYIIPAMEMDTCPRCGKPCDLWNRDTWARVVRRRVSDAIWYKPWTWRASHWEYKSRGFLEEDGFNYRTALRHGREEAES
jgi:hypothetical protein